ncbi:SDR family NAD(P)-dependent oxidoreductase [Arthrobacter sp. EPSL27]|uniref:SDR family NAD(P)-dependent oxidoreductase n=1 Tax=Arthrobacter sp. EPSL27 TaxID=1745378 RepID=UPI000748ED0F|nr:glucose 1-dehydrogenase [Arthrobacter sp. EPSL27]KUM37415.1 hypothetical protein AR539_09140 [Arthrobacter sp. EPSL27]
MDNAKQMIAPDLSRDSLPALFSLEHRLAVVTGGGSGIGLAIAKRFAEMGATVVITDRDETLADDAVAACGPRARFLRLDMRKHASIGTAVEGLAREFGRLDIWVNNAGIYPSYDPLNTTPEQMAEIFELNITGAHMGTQTAARTMQETGCRGVILNILSTGAYRGSGAYSASKWALRGLTSGLATELGCRGIRILAIAPSVTLTNGLSQLLGASKDASELVSGITAKMPLGRVGVPDDIARVAAFLASDAAAFMTGQTIVVDGGSLTSI